MGTNRSSVPAPLGGAHWESIQSCSLRCRSVLHTQQSWCTGKALVGTCCACASQDNHLHGSSIAGHPRCCALRQARPCSRTGIQLKAEDLLVVGDVAGVAGAHNDARHLQGVLLWMSSREHEPPGWHGEGGQVLTSPAGLSPHAPCNLPLYPVPVQTVSDAPASTPRPLPGRLLQRDCPGSTASPPVAYPAPSGRPRLRWSRRASWPPRTARAAGSAGD